MDISVSKLNRRMALQLPAEFPLGLVFVVGEVEVDATLRQEDGLREFYLLEGDHLLLCQLSTRAAEEVALNQGDLIRAGGHIVFDPARARYCLLARDVELLREYEPSGPTLGEIIAISEQKPVDDLAPAALPQWVKELAPPEVQEEWAARRMAEAGAALAAAGVLKASEEAESSSPVVAVETWQEFVADDVSLAYTNQEPALAELSDELIEFLSEAIDSNDDVELTPAMLAEYTPPDPPAPPAPVEEPSPQVLTPDPERAYAAQDASIEEFLSALEAAISADEARLQQQESKLESNNGQPVAESVAETPDISPVEELLVVEIAADETKELAASEPAASPAQQPSQKPQPGQDRQQPQKLPWFIVLLVILAALLLFAIMVVLMISAGILPLIAT